MRLLAYFSAVFLLFVCSVSLNLAAEPQKFTAIPLRADAPPVRAQFLFPSGPSLGQFTVIPEAWYSVFKLTMLPGHPYGVRLSHGNDLGRVNLYALDDHPFGRANLRQELPLSRVLTKTNGRLIVTYESTFTISNDVQMHGIHLLLEWVPQANQRKPSALTLEVFDLSSRSGRNEEPSMHRIVPPAIRSPLQDQTYQRPFEIPLQRPVDEPVRVR